MAGVADEDHIDRPAAKFRFVRDRNPRLVIPDSARGAILLHAPGHPGLEVESSAFPHGPQRATRSFASRTTLTMTVMGAPDTHHRSIAGPLQRDSLVSIPRIVEDGNRPNNFTGRILRQKFHIKSAFLLGQQLLENCKAGARF